MFTPMGRVGIVLCAGGLLLGAAVTAPGFQQAPPAPVNRQTYRVAMADGVHLATDVYLPAGTGRVPAVVLRTPYDRNQGRGIGADGTRRGYVVVIQDTRGRSASEGRNLPFEGDGWWEGRQDGVDTLRWVAAQPWCSGKIGTMGGSALGITQLYAAAAGARPLDAQVIHVGAPSFFHHLTFSGGVFRKAMIEDWLRGTRHDSESLAFWTRSSRYDAFWRERDMSRRYTHVNVPAVHVGGWYDIFAQGVIDAYQGYQRHGGPRSRGTQKLVMGPWTHGIFRDAAGDLSFRGGARPPGSISDPWAWLDHHLKGVDNGIERTPAVTYYTMGDTSDPKAPGNEWRTADRWPPHNAPPTRWYLHGGGVLSPDPPGKAESRSFFYDPADPCPTVGGPQLTLPSGTKDQRPIEGRPDVLLFTSAPLSEPVEVTGRVRLRLWAASDGADTDFAAKLCDVYPDGRSYNVCEGILRARFRGGFDHERPLKPGKRFQAEVDLWSTSIVFARGHRLRLLVTSSNAPGWDPNPNTGEPFRAGTRTRVAKNTLFLAGSAPSHLLLPVAPGR